VRQVGLVWRSRQSVVGHARDWQDVSRARTRWRARWRVEWSGPTGLSCGWCHALVHHVKVWSGAGKGHGQDKPREARWRAAKGVRIIVNRSSSCVTVRARRAWVTAHDGMKDALGAAHRPPLTVGNPCLTVLARVCLCVTLTRVCLCLTVLARARVCWPVRDSACPCLTVLTRVCLCLPVFDSVCQVWHSTGAGQSVACVSACFECMECRAPACVDTMPDETRAEKPPKKRRRNKHRKKS